MQGVKRSYLWKCKNNRTITVISRVSPFPCLLYISRAVKKPLATPKTKIEKLKLIIIGNITLCYMCS